MVFLTCVRLAFVLMGGARDPPDEFVRLKLRLSASRCRWVRLLKRTRREFE